MIASKILKSKNNNMKQAQTITQQFAEQQAKLRAEHEICLPMALYIDNLSSAWHHLATRISVFNNGGPFATIDLTKTPLANVHEILTDIKLRAYLDVVQPTKICDQLTDHKSPFRFRIENGINEIEASIKFFVKLDGGQIGQISIDVPLAYYSDDIIGHGYRGVYETQRHYFPGMSAQRIGKLKIPCAWLELFDRINWYGGDKETLVMIQEDVEQFEHVIFNGHTPEFTEFWTNQLRHHE